MYSYFFFNYEEFYSESFVTYAASKKQKTKQSVHISFI